MLDMKKVIKKFLVEVDSNSAECSRRVGWQRSNLYDKYKRGTFYITDLEKIAAAYGYEVEVHFVKPKQD